MAPTSRTCATLPMGSLSLSEAPAISTSRESSEAQANSAVAEPSPET